MYEEDLTDSPIKKRKLNNGNASAGTSDKTDTANQSQNLLDNPENLTLTPATITDTPKEPIDVLNDSTGSVNNSSKSSTVSQDKFHNIVTPEELERLRQFHVLDEVKSNDEDSNEENSEDSDEYNMYEEDLTDSPIKKRKLNNGNASAGTSDETDTANQSQNLLDNPENLTLTPATITDTPKEPIDVLNDSTGSVNNSSKSSTVSQDKFHNIVTPEELERLRQFHVLDEVKSNDEDSNEENSEDSDGKSVDLPDEEIEMMLEADLPDAIKGAPKPKEKPFITRQKIVLEEKGINHFEVLPLDWIMVRHISGMPIYMQRSTRVCTLSKPYFLGKNNIRRHDIPISAIPCYAYRRALEEEEKQKEIDKRIEEQIRSGVWANRNESSQGMGENGIQTNNNNSTNITRTNRSLSEFQDSQTVSSKGQEQVSSQSQQTFESTNQNLDSVVDQNPKSASCPIEFANQVEHEPTRSTCQKVSQCKQHLKSTTTVHENESPTNSEMSEFTEFQKPESVDQEMRDSKDQDVLDAQEQQIPTDERIPKFSSPTFDSKANLMTATFLAEAAIIKEEILEGLPQNDCPVINETVSAEINRMEEDNKSMSSSANEAIPLNRQPVILPGGIMMPPPRVETINTSWKTQHLTAEQINNYCKRLFKFKTVNIMHFKRWADRRKYTKARKTLQYPTLPEGTKLITIPAQPAGPGQENGGKASKRDWVMNMNDRSYLSVFHEYVRRALQKQPVYHFRQLENASQPYQAIVYIGGMQYGVGYGSSKRQAKSAAARASIHILIPEMKDELNTPEPGNSDNTQPDFHEFFDLVGIEDPRISEFCAATCEPSPHATLRTCLLRNFGAGDRHIHTEIKKLEFQKIELIMKVGKHTASVVCKNKKTAKQRASQAILQALHPHVRSWGSLLRLYGSKSVKSCKEKKLEEQQITLLQDKARHNEPNYAVLEKLRHEMRKLRERDEAVVPIGTLLVREDLPTHSGSNLNNVDL